MTYSSLTYKAFIAGSLQLTRLQRDLECLSISQSDCLSPSFLSFLNDYHLRRSGPKVESPKGFQMTIMTIKTKKQEKRWVLKGFLGHKLFSELLPFHLNISKDVDYEGEEEDNEDLISIFLEIKAPLLIILKNLTFFEDAFIEKIRHILNHLDLNIVGDSFCDDID